MILFKGQVISCHFFPQNSPMALHFLLNPSRSPFFMAYKALHDTVLVTGLTSTLPSPHSPHPAHSITLCWPLVQALQTHSYLGVFAIVLSSAWNTFPQIPAKLNPSLSSRLCSNLTFSSSLCEILLPAPLQYFQSPPPTLLFIFYRAPISLGHTKSFSYWLCLLFIG